MLQTALRFFVVNVIALFRVSLLLVALPVSAEQIEKGKEVPVVLLTKLTTWPEMRGGEPIRLVVMGDVTSDNGKVLIKKGATVYGRVAWSRATPAISADGARLHILIESTKAVDSQSIPLMAIMPETDKNLWCKLHGGGKYLNGVLPCVDIKRDDPERTTDVLRTSALENFRNEPGAKDFLKKLSNAVDKGDISTIINDPTNMAMFAKLVGAANIPATKQAIDNNDVKQLSTTLQKLVTGGGPINFTNGADYVNGAIELIGLVVKFRNATEGWFKGKNITVVRGTPLTAYVAQDVVIHTTDK